MTDSHSNIQQDAEHYIKYHIILSLLLLYPSTKKDAIIDTTASVNGSAV